MLSRISSIPGLMLSALLGFIRSIKDDERGLSGVVVAILLILIAVLAVVIIWGFLSGWLQELWLRVIGETAEM